MTQPATMSRLATGGKDDWCTPVNVLRRVRLLGDGSHQPIGLDPCTSNANPTDARTFYTLEDDGLSRDWLSGSDGDLIFVNPPYSKAKAWAEKIVAEAERGVEVASLVAARPDAKWFCRLVWESADAVCFWKGRLRFEGAPSSAPFPSAVVYHGSRPWRFEAAFHDAGAVLRLREGF